MTARLSILGGRSVARLPNPSRVGFRVPRADTIDVAARALEVAMRDASAEVLKLAPWDRAVVLRRVGEAYRRMLASKVDAREAEALAMAFVNGILREVRS